MLDFTSFYKENNWLLGITSVPKSETEGQTYATVHYCHSTVIQHHDLINTVRTDKNWQHKCYYTSECMLPPPSPPHSSCHSRETAATTSIDCMSLELLCKNTEPVTI